MLRKTIKDSQNSLRISNLFIKIGILVTIALLVLVYLLSYQAYLSLTLFAFLFFLSLIPVAIVITSEAHLLNPLLVFSIYYYILIVSILTSVGRIKIEKLVEGSIVVLLSYIFFVLGFLMFINKRLLSKSVLGEMNYIDMPIAVSKVVMFVFFLIGLSNYIFVLYKTVNLRFWEYYLNLGFYGRNLKEIFGLSTLGYLFLHPAIYIAIYAYVKQKLNRYIFYMLFFVYAIIILSLAKITYFALQIIIFITLLFALKNDLAITFKRIFLLLLFVILVLSLFLYRMVADIARVKRLDVGEIFLSVLDIDSLYFLFFEKSNLPNINIIVFIMDHWGKEIDYLKGMSLVNIISGFMPADIRTFLVHNFSVSWIIKNQWFTHQSGGAIPPTIIGELFANFGYFGVFVMFFLGIITANIFNWVFKNLSYPKLIFYTYFLWKFVFLMAKGEFSRISDINMLISIVAVATLKSLNQLRFCRNNREKNFQSNLKEA